MGKHSQNTNKRDILNFIKCMNEKNYAEANKYLKDAVNQKMANTIRRHVKKDK